MWDDVFPELFSDNQTPYKMFIALLRFLCNKNGRNFEINKEEWKAFLGMAFIMSAYL